MAGSVVVRDRGAAKLVQTITDPSKAVVDVGVIGSAGDAQAQDGEFTVAQLAEWHEFGVGVPQRSFLRAWADAETAKIEQVIRGLTKRIIEGKLTREQALEQFGAWAAGQVQAFISAGRVVPVPERADGLTLDPTTIARKGSSIPLIDTGQLRQSITYEVRPG